jgi:transposase
MYIDIRNNKNKPPKVLLRESVRVRGKVVKNEIADLSLVQLDIVLELKDYFQKKQTISVDDIIKKVYCENTIPTGHIDAVIAAANRIDLPALIDPNPSEERDIILGLVVARIINPKSKLYTAEWWNTNSLANVLNLHEFNEQDAYKAMDWLLLRQSQIEKKLAARHLKEGDFIFLDVSSSYYEGVKSTLAYHGGLESLDCELDESLSSLIRFGYSRDRKRGKAQINFSLITDKEGKPISIEAFPGNTPDSMIFRPTVDKIKSNFNIYKPILVGDRGMINNKDITILKQTEGVKWLSALRSTSIKKLIPEEGFRTSIFDEHNIFEFIAPNEFPGERLIACRNHELMEKRSKTRDLLIKKTIDDLEKIKERIRSKRLKKKEDIGRALGRVENNQKVSKYFVCKVEDNSLEYSLNEERIESEKILDGIYVIRTSLPIEALNTEDCVKQYKNLAQVEKAFRTMKTVGLKVRPIFHRLDNRIRSHLFLIMLSYYLEWHMREAWKELTFSEPNLAELKNARDPVAQATKSKEVYFKGLKKVTIEDPSIKVQQFDLILQSLASICEVKLSLKTGSLFEIEIPFLTRKEYTPLQKKALELVNQIPMYPRK